MRTDRTVSIVLSKFKKNASDNKIPILMYHSITPEIKNKKHPYFCTATTPKTFEKQLRFLKENGYNIIRLADLCANQFENSEKKVILTFDDGYIDFYEYALPLLKKYQCTATVFIPSGLIDSNNRVLKNKELMNWEQIRECSGFGVDFGSHSLTHTILTDLSSKELDFELCESKKIIEDKLKLSANLFSYPYRFPEENRAFIKNILNLLKKYEYTLAVTTRIGRVASGDNYLSLKRIPVNEYDNEQFLKAKIEGAYDWLYKFQYIKKNIELTLKSLRPKQ